MQGQRPRGHLLNTTSQPPLVFFRAKGVEPGWTFGGNPILLCCAEYAVGELLSPGSYSPRRVYLCKAQISIVTAAAALEHSGQMLLLCVSCISFTDFDTRSTLTLFYLLLTHNIRAQPHLLPEPQLLLKIPSLLHLPKIRSR